MNRRATDVIVIGAGPYGLAALAHLRDAGIEARGFGSLMSFWMRHMPKGMLLKSSWRASRIADPRAAYSLDEFERARGASIPRPIPLGDFVAYGSWFHTRAALEVDPRQVQRVDPTEGGFRLTLDDGEPIHCRRVVVAAGIAQFAQRPGQFAGLPSDLASHASEHTDLSVFSGKRVAVVGAGQSGLESAVLLREAGAEVEVIVRAPRARWVGGAPRENLRGRLLYDWTDVGPALVSHVVARPMFVRRLPVPIQRNLTRRSIAAGGAQWLRPRATGLAITAGRHVTRAARSGGQITLTFDDGGTRTVDHVLLATGYRVDLRNYGFLAPDLLAQVRCVEGYPVLDAGFESSVPGLHFLGATATGSFGPLVRFVAGTTFAGRALANAVRASASRSARSLGQRAATHRPDLVTLSGNPDERTVA